jgi:hypothetical protein
VSVKVQNLKHQELITSKAGEQIDELRFLLSEVERKESDSV